MSVTFYAVMSAPPRYEPPLESWPDAGVYQLWLCVSDGQKVTVGRLGRVHFAAGVYVYTGRASRGLRARVQRHVRGAGGKHWHIDYLLAARRVRIERVVLVSRDPEQECAINQATGAEENRVARGFGASDCRNRCGSHLTRLARS